MLTPDTAVEIIANAVHITAVIVCVLVVPSLIGGFVRFQIAVQEAPTAAPIPIVGTNALRVTVF